LILVLGFGEKRNKYNVSVAKPEGRRSLEICRYRWEAIIKMNLKERAW
jgi:hypothetical protein